MLWVGDNGKYVEERVQVFDRSLDGVGIRLTRRALPVGQAVWIEENKVLVQAVVRHCRPCEGGYVAGLLKTGLGASADAAAMAVLRRAMPALALLLCIDAVYNLVALDSNMAPGLSVLSLIAAAVCVWLGVLTRRGDIQLQQAHPLTALVAGILLLNSLAHVVLDSQSQQVVVIVLLLVGAAYTFQSLKWLLGFQAASVAAWAFAGWLALPSPVWQHLTLTAAAVAALSFADCRNRLAKLRRKQQDQMQQEHQQRELQRQIQKKKERDTLPIEAAGDGHWYWDLRADKIYFSRQWAAMLGYEEGELGTNPDEWFDRIHPYYVPEFKEALSAHLYGKTQQFQSQHRVQHRDGTYIWVLIRGLALRDAHGNPTAIAGSQIDVTVLMEVEKKIVDDAFHDKLTGLPNRQALLVRLEGAFDRLKKSGPFLFVVMFLDLDRFKVINDSLGHLVGDQLLAAAAARLRGTLRERSGDMVARFGGDEFVILMEDLRGAEQALAVASRVQDVLAEPFKLGKHEVRTRASIGVAFSNTKIEKPEDLLRNADTAMYHAKAQRKGDVQIFNAEMHSEALRLHQLQNDLGRALDRQELLLYYQPVISMQSGRIVGAEALLRWQHSGGEIIGPAEFIPLAEETGAIVSIGEWALRAACSQNVVWQRAGYQPLTVAVNLSAHQIRQEDFPQTVARILMETRLDANWLELELTETALMENLDAATRILNRLLDCGVHVSIDDFGTGYSSLSYLRRFVVNSLKMDRSFVADLTTDGKSAAVARGLITLAHELGLTVTAEGVETHDQLSFLGSHGCDRVQGYLASRPLPAKEFAELARSIFNLYDRVGTIPFFRDLAVASSQKPN